MMLCEMSRRPGRHRDEMFEAIRTVDGITRLRNGVGSGEEVSWVNLKFLARDGLLHMENEDQNSLTFVVTPEGFDRASTASPALATISLAPAIELAVGQISKLPDEARRSACVSLS